jgi:PAP2 superfamily
MLQKVEFTTELSILKRNFGWLALSTVMMSAIYLSLNHFPRESVHANYLFPWERKIPLIIGSVVSYWAALVVSFLVPLCVKHKPHLRSILLVNAASFLLNLTVWIFYPVSYPRPALPADDGSLSFLIYRSLLELDSPLNSLPSGHVTLMCSVGWVALACRGLMRPVLIICAIVGTLSIFTTKQHSLIDAVAGALTMHLGYRVVRYANFRTVSSKAAR